MGGRETSHGFGQWTGRRTGRHITQDEAKSGLWINHHAVKGVRQLIVSRKKQREDTVQRLDKFF
jgi:hypothetical protein